MPTISASSYDRFRTCPRLYYYEHVLRFVRTREDGARRFGSLYHAGLEAWWNAMDGGDVPWREADAAYVAAMKALAENAKHVDTDRFEVARAEALITAYHARHFELDFESVVSGGGVELWFEMPLRDEGDRVISGWTVIGRMDVIKRFADGRVKPVEHKHTAQDIAPGTDYWRRLAVDTQAGIYVDAARYIGFPDVREAFYDVTHKPGAKPLLKTPEERRRMTKGKGCPQCGGRSGGKLGAAKGTGRIIIQTEVDGDGRKLARKMEVEVDCTSCAGTGWHEPPRLAANQRTEDESVDDFRARVRDEILEDPNAYFRQASVMRNDDQLAELRADLVVTTGEIETLLRWARADSNGELESATARRRFPRNSQACTSIHGRRCDFLDVCSGGTDPWTSPHYALKPQRQQAKIVHFDAPGHGTQTDGEVQP